MVVTTRGRLLAVFVAMGVQGAAASMYSQSAGPLTPGALAIQAATRGPLPDTVLRAALVDTRPEMRLTAARIVGVTHAVAFTANLVEALQQETEIDTAVEQMRSLLLLRTRESVAAAESYARRAQGKPLHAVASWLARTAPAEFADRLADFASLDRPGTVLDMASRHWPAERQALIRTWLSRVPAHWPHLLPHLIRMDTAEADLPVVLEALRAADDRTREATVWFVVSRMADKVAVPNALLEAVATYDAVAPGSLPTWEMVGRELVARWHRKADTPDRAAYFASHPPSHPRDIRSLYGIGVLTGAETDVLRRRLGDDFRERPLPIRPGAPAWSSTPMMRTSPALYPGFLGSLLSASQCAPAANQAYVAVNLTYSADGRPTRADLEPTSQGCRAALAGLVQVTIADDTYPVRDGTTEWMVLLLEPDAVACADAADAPEERDPSTIRSFAAPRRTKTVQPSFPKAEAAARASGSVVVEGILSRTGCLRTAAVPRSTGTYTFRDTRTVFALAALRAVVQWRFEPARIDDVPTPVTLSVTVNFTPR